MITYVVNRHDFDLPLPYMFQYVVDIRKLLTLSDRLSSPTVYREIVACHRADIEGFLSAYEDVRIAHCLYGCVYIQSISEDWLVMAKLSSRMFYRGIIEAHFIRSECHVS